MKRIIIPILIFLGIGVKAQVGIEKVKLKSKGSIMEFNDMREPNGKAKGIILPILTDTRKVKQGAIWFDAKSKKVMYKSASEEVALTNSADKEIVAPTSSSSASEGVIISDGSLNKFTDDPAILKLDSKKAALLLPYVQDVTKDISNPEPGTMVYDAKSKSLAIFNGSHWYFWN